MTTTTRTTYPLQLQFVCIQFPDPHFKARHAKRRVVTPELVYTVTPELVYTLAQFMPKGAMVLSSSLHLPPIWKRLLSEIGICWVWFIFLHIAALGSQDCIHALGDSVPVATTIGGPCWRAWKIQQFNWRAATLVIEILVPKIGPRWLFATNGHLMLCAHWMHACSNTEQNGW